mgnify:CR=1 FL=1
MNRTRFALILIALILIALILGPCFLTSNPPAPVEPDEPGAADSTGP